MFGFGEGTYAEFTAAAITDIAAIPEKMEFAVAAALPTAGLTALQAIRDYVQPKPGTRILIHGAAGAVGSFATQIAKRWGAQVIGTASGEDIVYLRSLGHVQVVDYKQERFETVGQVDAVLDLIGGETATRSYAVVKKGGVMVSTVGAANAELAAQAGIRAVNMVMQAKRRGPVGAGGPGGTRRREATDGRGVSAGSRRARHRMPARKAGPRAKSC